MEEDWHRDIQKAEQGKSNEGWIGSVVDEYCLKGLKNQVQGMNGHAASGLP